MNLVLLADEDMIDGDRAVLRGRRHRHVRRILRAAVGDTLCVGREGGRIGRGRITSLDTREVVLEIELDEDPPPPLAVTLALAMPRPPVLGRVLAAATTFGVKHIALFHSRRVEKTYWQAGAVEPEAIRDKLRLGLEQARDTVLPHVELHPRFSSFVDNALPGLLEGAVGYLAHPVEAEPCPARLATPCLVGIGPEGGFIDSELERFEAAGLQCVRLGDRALRVETAVAALLSRALL